MNFIDFLKSNQAYPKNIVFKNDSQFIFTSTLEAKIHCVNYSQENISAPVIVLFHGLGAHTETKGYQHIKDFWYSQGYHVVGMDVRNQSGKTISNISVSKKGLYASRIFSKSNYFYHIYFDAISLLKIVRKLYPTSRIITTGGSQGGTLAIISSIFNDFVKAILADMPNCIHIPQLIETSNGGFNIFKSNYFKFHRQSKHIENSLNQVDLIHYVDEIKIPILLSSGNLDTVCPLKNLKSFYGNISSKKSLCIYEGYSHGGFDDLHFLKKLAFLKTIL